MTPDETRDLRALAERTLDATLAELTAELRAGALADIVPLLGAGPEALARSFHVHDAATAAEAEAVARQSVALCIQLLGPAALKRMAARLQASNPMRFGDVQPKSEVPQA